MVSLLGHVPPGATTVEEVVRHRLAEGVGGVRGSVEAALPTVAFVVAWSATHDVRTSLGAAAASASSSRWWRDWRSGRPRSSR